MASWLEKLRSHVNGEEVTPVEQTFAGVLRGLANRIDPVTPRRNSETRSALVRELRDAKRKLARIGQVSTAAEVDALLRDVVDGQSGQTQLGQTRIQVLIRARGARLVEEHYVNPNELQGLIEEVEGRAIDIGGAMLGLAGDELGIKLIKEAVLSNAPAENVAQVLLREMVKEGVNRVQQEANGKK